MKKSIILFLTILLVSILSACSKEKVNQENTIIVGSSYTPHAEILERAKPLLEEKGYQLEIIKYQDYIFPNKNLTEGELDANYFQHIPYLNQYNEQYDTDIVNAGGIHIEPIGIYSTSFNSLDDIADGATVIMSNSVSDEPRLVALLVEKGLITLNDGVTPSDVSVSQIEDFLATNPKNLNFRNDVDPGMLVTTYNTEDNVIVLINTNYALDGDLNPLEDALALEDGTVDNPYVNIIGVRNGDESSPKIQALVEVLKSDEMKQFILDTYEGAVIPAE